MAIALWKDMKEPVLLDGEPQAPSFGNDGLLDARSPADRLDSEEAFVDRRPLLPGVGRENIQIAQGWNGSPPIVPQRVNPGSRGYDIQGREALEGLGDVPQVLDQNSEFRAQGRQRNIWGQFEADKRRLEASKTPEWWYAKEPERFYWTDGNTPAPVGRGETWKTSEGKYFIDRNGDGTPDRILQYRDGKALMDDGDGSGLLRYHPGRFRPAPNRK